MSKLLTGHQLRKRMNFKSAAVRDREHMDANPIPDGLNNRATDIRPTPPARQQNEFTISKALSIFPKSSVDEAVLKEITKCFTTYKSLRLINFKDLEEGAIFVRSQCIIRDKLNNELTARIPVGPQPEGTYNETFAGTTDANHRQFALATAQASAAHRGKTLNTGSCDIPAAFLNGNKLSGPDIRGAVVKTVREGVGVHVLPVTTAADLKFIRLRNCCPVNNLDTYARWTVVAIDSLVRPVSRDA
jgi:hypothetical protein